MEANEELEDEGDENVDMMIRLQRWYGRSHRLCQPNSPHAVCTVVREVESCVCLMVAPPFVTNPSEAQTGFLTQCNPCGYVLSILQTKSTQQSSVRIPRHYLFLISKSVEYCFAGLKGPC